MSILLPDSRPLSVNPRLWATPNGSRDKGQPHISFMGSLPISWSSSSAASSAAMPALAERPRSFLEFAEKSSSLWTPARHLVFLAGYLEALKRRDIGKLMIEMPPRHAKSTTVDELFLPYWLLERPDDRAVLTSYESDFARTWGRKARAVVKEIGPERYGYGVKTDTDAANDWEIDGHRGGMFTTGIGGPITGRGFDVGVIDDPVKNAQEAQSEDIQERNIDWYHTTFTTRKEPDAVEMLILSRWHEGDLAGRLLDEAYHEWTVVQLPALAEHGDMLGREIDEALWPERYDTEALADIRYGKVDPATGQRRGGVGTYVWSAMYQQHPSPLEGGMFRRDWWKRFRWEELEHLRSEGKLQGMGFLDTAQIDKPGSDYTALGTWFTDHSRYFVADMLRARYTFPDLIRAILDWYAKWHLPLVIEETPWCMP